MEKEFIDMDELAYNVRKLHLEFTYENEIATAVSSYNLNVDSKRDLIYLTGTKNKKTPFKPRHLEDNKNYPMLYRLGMGCLYDDEGIDVECLDDEDIVLPKRPRRKRTYNKKKKICSKKKVVKKLTWKEKLLNFLKRLVSYEK